MDSVHEVFNSISGDLVDYEYAEYISPICSFDNVINSYGRLFIEFHFNVNFCVLNEKHSKLNGYTMASSGICLVDYCSSFDMLRASNGRVCRKI